MDTRWLCALRSTWSFANQENGVPRKHVLCYSKMSPPLLDIMYCVFVEAWTHSLKITRCGGSKGKTTHFSVVCRGNKTECLYINYSRRHSLKMLWATLWIEISLEGAIIIGKQNLSSGRVCINWSPQPGGNVEYHGVEMFPVTYSGRPGAWLMIGQLSLNCVHKEVFLLQTFVKALQLR